jgi:hypothetical protein
MPEYTTYVADIANGTALSQAIDMRGRTPYGIIMPSAWTAAGITFQVSNDGVNFADLYDETAEYSLTVAADQAIGFPGGNLFSGFKFIKVRSGTTGTPVNQGADRAIEVVALD